MKWSSISKLLWNLPKTIFFNFYYLPFSQAIKLPIVFLSGVKLYKMKGKIILSTKPYTGMITIGSGYNPLYMQHNNVKAVWANYGGTVIFGAQVALSRGVAIEIGSEASLVFGEKIHFGPMSRIACYKEIIIGNQVRISWEAIITDTDFHQTINTYTGERSIMTKPIKIGNNNWIGIRSIIMKGTETPNFCIVSAYSLLNKKYDVPQYSLLGGIPAKFLKEGLYRDMQSHVNRN